MKVDIKNRQERTGMLRKTDHYWVDVSVIFSEEEKQIIKQHRKENPTLVERENPKGEKEGPSSITGKLATLAWQAATGPNDSHLRVFKLLKGTDSWDLPDPLSARDYQDDVMARLRNFKEYLVAQAAGTSDTSAEF